MRFFPKPCIADIGAMKYRFIVWLLLFTGCGETDRTQLQQAGAESRSEPIAVQQHFGVIVHGGAGNYRRSYFTPLRQRLWTANLEKARDTAYGLLASGASAVDAVEAAVAMLERDTLFNAGRGAAPNRQGQYQLDASIMRGSDRQCGAVAAVMHQAAPVRAARIVLDRSPHVLLAGPGADRWCHAQGLDSVPNRYFETQRMRRYWQKKFGETDTLPGGRGTVGAVALDQNGKLAAATSTGGRAGKTPGRVGDSPLIGSGVYASSRCGVSATGNGEYYIRGVLAYDLDARMRYQNMTLAEAAQKVIHHQLKSLAPAEDARGGLIAMDAQGRMCARFNTPGMLYSLRRSDGTASSGLYQEK